LLVRRESLSKIVEYKYFHSPVETTDDFLENRKFATFFIGTSLIMVVGSDKLLDNLQNAKTAKKADILWLLSNLFQDSMKINISFAQD
jgi:hypothetical protein